MSEVPDPEALAVACSVVRWVDEVDGWPGCVEARLTDADGRTWVIIEKGPVVGGPDFHAKTAYPVPGWLACQILTRGTDSAGEPVVTVSTELPWHIESVEGETVFKVRATQLVQRLDGSAVGE